MTLPTPLTPAQKVSLNLHLCSYDQTCTLDCICDQLRNPEKYEKVPVIWEVFENYPLEDTIMSIIALAENIQEAIDEQIKF